MLRKLLMVCAASACLAAGSAAAQGGRTTRLIVAFPSGGPVDFVARVLAEQLTKEIGHTVIVENKAGANGNIGAEFVAKAAPDGSVLLLTSVGAVAISPALYEKLPYDLQRDFAPVSVVVNNATVFVVNPNNPASNAAEFVAATKQRKESTPVGSSGVGSIPHLTLELFADSSKAKVLHVPYKGAAPVITDVIGGQVSGFFGDLPGLIGHIRGGRLKPLGIAAAKRLPLLPQVSTLAEQGIAGVESNNWYALVAPAKTPPDQIDAFNRAVRRALAAEPVRAKLIAAGAEPAPSSPEELAALIKNDGAKWAGIIKEKGVKPE